MREQQGILKKFELKTIPILIPIAALALVLTSALVKSAISAKIVELIAPVP